MGSMTASLGPVVGYTIGIDIGQKRDPTAIAVEEIRERTILDRTESIYVTRHLERLPLGTSYPRVAARLSEIVHNAQIAASRQFFEDHGVTADRTYDFDVFIDATGVGQPVVDILAETGLSIQPVYFTHGDRRTEEGGRITLGKAWLVSRLKTLFQTERIRLPPSHPEAQAMMNELLDYEIRVDERANDKYGAFKTGAHDDLVTAVGLATQVASTSWLSAPTGALAAYLSNQ